uniref:Uncharacterized protein n=1 Tax=Lepeophtheirus salmonis TaxID=72036 RepID=A0A0K2UHT8_LEPSM
MYTKITIIYVQMIDSRQDFKIKLFV